MKITRITLFVAMASLLAITGASAQQLYRCTGSDGRVVYSDRKCASNEKRQVVKITDNSMDNSNLQSTAAIRASLNSAMAGQGGGNVVVIGNNSGSSASSSSSSSSQRPARRRCGG